MRLAGWLISLLVLAVDAAADGLPLEASRRFERDLDVGTWLSLATSPDGRSMAFDLLGDLYVMPSSGGRARLLLGGLAYEAQPVFSPDGQWLAFVSDRSGSDNLWIVRADGSGLRQLTSNDDESVYVSPEWRADGAAVFVSRFRPDLNAYELLVQPLAGEPEVVVPIRAARGEVRDGWRSALGASASRDGRWLYYARRTGRIEFDALNRWVIVRRDLASGAETVVVSGFDGRGAERETYFRPQISPDGRQLAYATRRLGETELRVRDLASGHDRSLGPVEPDALQSSAWLDLLPRYAFTPDGTAIVVSRGGSIERRALDGAVAKVPFAASVSLAIGPSTRVDLREPTGPVRARLPQAPIGSPDGRFVAYSAFGRIYVQRVDGSSPARALPDASDAAFQPAWSADGRRIVFVTWSENAGGAVWVAPADGSASPRRIDDGAAFYTYPAFSPRDGGVLVTRSAMAARQQSSFEVGLLRAAELVALAPGGGAAKRLASGRFGGRLQFTADVDAAYLQAADGLNRVDLATGRLQRVVQVKGAAYYFQESPVPVDELRISRDGRWLLAQVAQQLYLVPRPGEGVVEIDLLRPGQSQRRITDIGADYFEFTRDGGIEWSAGPQFWRMDRVDAKPRRLADLAVERPRVRPSGSIVLRGARVHTMAQGDRVIEDADVVVTGDRIVAVGPRGTVDVPAGATVRDVHGRFIVPGFIDVHDHIGSIRRKVLSFEDWGLRARLAYGVTTSFDPSTLSVDMLAYQDLIDAGLVLGPRLRSTGPAIFSYNRFASLDDVRAVLRRYREAYGLGNIKQYRAGNRRVRQWIAIAAREIGLHPTTEGALSLKLDVSQILDGFAGHEHALPAELHDDILDLLVQTRTSYTTTLLVTHGGAPAADWFVSQRDPAVDPKIRRFWPPSAIRSRLLDRPWISRVDHRFESVARDAALLAARGGLVGIGSHGEVPGIGFHWEMEAHVLGGMSAATALHAGTAGSAETIGRLADLGTIEPGKLADIVVLERDPVADIRNTTAIEAVMRGGTLYDAETLAELWPRAGKPPTPWFAGRDEERWLPQDAR
jgi:Tol biopolymer transport system component